MSLAVALILLFCSVVPGAFEEASALELTAQEQAFIANHGPVRIHNETDWPPFNFFENGSSQGISIDVMNRVAELTGLPIKYVTGPSWSEFTEMIRNDQLDVMLNIIDLPERRKLFSFTTPYVKSLTGVFVGKGNRHSYYSFADLSGRTVAVPAGFDLEINMPKYHPDVKILPVRDILACIEAVTSGKADAFMEEIGVVDYIVSQRVMPTIQMAFQVLEEPFMSNLRIGTRVQEPLLHSIIQKGLNAISPDELNKIRQKWLLQAHEIYEQSMVSLTVAEKEYLYENNTVRICVDPSWQPLDFIDREGHHSGLSADLVNAIARRLDVSLQLVATTTWEQSLQTIRRGDCDIIPLMNETDEAGKYLDFTQPYFNFATVIVTRKDASFIGDYTELYGKTVALQAYYFITDYVKKLHPQINIIEVENTREALKLVSEKKAFATIDGLPGIVNAIESLALENVKIVGSVPQQNSMKMGIRKDREILLGIFDKGIMSLSDREKIGLYKKWLNIEVEDQLLNRSMVMKIGTVLVLFIVVLLWRQLSLRRYAMELKKLNLRLQHASTVDHLTQILNRGSIEKRLQAEIDRCRLTRGPLTIVLFDIDHFKAVNDTYGHLAGDNVLKGLATLVSDSIRDSDHFGRWGGEEFLIVLQGTTVKGGTSFVEKIRQAIETYPFGIEKNVTASFGVGEYQPDEDLAHFISRIDSCLYEAKSQGRNRIVQAL